MANKPAKRALRALPAGLFSENKKDKKTVDQPVRLSYFMIICFKEVCMSTNVLTVTEAVRHFSDYISRVAYRRESFVLRKGNKSMAELRPLPSSRKLGDLPSILRSAPHLSSSDANTFAADVDAARTNLPDGKLRDPWAS